MSIKEALSSLNISQIEEFLSDWHKGYLETDCAHAKVLYTTLESSLDDTSYKESINNPNFWENHATGLDSKIIEFAKIVDHTGFDYF